MNWLRGLKTVFMLNSIEHEISKAKRLKNKDFLPSNSHKLIVFFMLIKFEMATIDGILTFMSIKFMLSSVKHKKSFITSTHGLKCLICSKLQE